MFKQANHIFCVGIGGIGMSGLARILHGQGKTVVGSDLVSSEITDELSGLGIKLIIGHRTGNLTSDFELLIYSVAVPEDNPERKKAAELNIAQLSYPQAVGELSRDYEKVIAVAGTNGKTTTTAMIGWILEQAGEDPTALVGSKVLAWNSNARVGNSNKYFVVEADEYKRAFLNYEPDVAVITNIEADHLDYFRDLADVKKAFREFTEKIKPGGTLVYNPDLPPSPGDGEGLRERSFHKLEGLNLNVPGKFNLANASAAAAACSALGIPEHIIRTALQSFSGTWRRFEKIGTVARPPTRSAGGFMGNVEIISDYAHHPSGIRAILETASQIYLNKKALIVFQPHQRNRTKNLFGDFVRAFCQSKISDFIISEIFDVAGREDDKDKDISSRDLVLEISKCRKNVQYASDLKDVKKKILQVINNYHVVLIMGAGDIYKVADKLIKT